MNNRKHAWASAALVLVAASLTAQTGGSPQQRHESLVVNIEVPVRVFKKNAFVEGLALQDFEVYENGVPQKIEAVYLIRNKQVLREEKTSAAALPAPKSSRHLVLYLDLKEYMSKATSGLTESTSNPDFGLRHAAEASNNYYLLCYRPLNYKADGKFKTIKVKGGGLQVTHRMGYVAD